MPAQPDQFIATLPAEVHALGFSLRKRPLVRRFLHESRVRFGSLNSVSAPQACIALWGSTCLTRPAQAAQTCAAERVLRLEDGFLRSVGLGADLTRPLSWVVDSRGIYYDARKPSDLEMLLQNTEFTPPLIRRAARLRARVVSAGVTKYNTGSSDWLRPEGPRPVILVPGQVEDDASIRFGTVDLHSNMQLLREVRSQRPDAYLLYKPHPDVAAGLRAAGDEERQAHRWCDEVLRNVPMDRLLAQVDEVHVLTSLTGFEALLRGIAVFTYGQPFYSGWGLTRDRHPLARRTRRLALDELVAAALLLYPRYASLQDGSLITAEQALDELLTLRAKTWRLPLPLADALRWPVRRVLRWTVQR